MPKEEELFRLFAEMGDRAQRSSLLMQRLFEGATDTDALRDEVARIENEVDDLRHECARRLNRTFVTPIMFGPSGHH